MKQTEHPDRQKIITTKNQRRQLTVEVAVWASGLAALLYVTERLASHLPF